MPPWQVVNVRFVLSFSGGKESILALHKMVEDGHEPIALLVMFRKESERSWVHGLDPILLSDISHALNIPLLCCNAIGVTYEGDMEQSLLRAKDMGAEACVFGDIDIEDHRSWDEARCTAVGLKAVLPLWKRNREECQTGCEFRLSLPRLNVFKTAYYRRRFWDSH